jgi:hypothetical protein
LLSTNSEGTPERTRENNTRISDALLQTTRWKEARTTQTRRKKEEVRSDEWVAMRGAQNLEGNSLVLLQTNCRSILNKFFDFWNLVDIYNPDVIIGTES